MNDVGLVNALRRASGLLAKRDIRSAAATFCHQPFPQLGLAGMLGDDAAVLPAQAGQLLLACEGMHPGLVEEDPWFAGWSGVLVNLSDIAAMGGRPLALVNSVWSTGRELQLKLGFLSALTNHKQILVTALLFCFLKDLFSASRPLQAETIRTL